MSRIFFEDFAFGASASIGTAHYAKAPYGASTPDPNYPYLHISESVGVGIGLGQNGENMLQPDPIADAGTAAAYFAFFGALPGGYWPAGRFKYSIDIYLDEATMDEGDAFSPIMSVYGREVVPPANDSHISLAMWRDTGDTWVLELTADRWNQAAYNVATFTFSQNAVKNKHHHFEIRFKHCTINDYGTDDVESDGVIQVLWNGVVIYSATDDFCLAFGGDADKALQGEAVSTGFYGLPGWVTNLEIATLDITAAHVFGVKTKATKSRTFSVGLDDQPHTNDEAGKFKLWGDFEARGTHKLISKDVGLGNFASELGNLWKHDAIARRRIRVSGSSAYTIDAEVASADGLYGVHIFDPSANITCNLPSVTAFLAKPASGYGRVLYLRNHSYQYIVTLDGSGTELIYAPGTVAGRQTFPLMPGATVKLIALDGTGAGWHAIDYKLPPTVVLITDAATKTLPTADVTTVPAPGVDWSLKPTGITLWETVATAVYTNINTTYAALQVSWDSSAGYWAAVPIVNDSVTASLARLTTFLGGSIHDAAVDLPCPYFEAYVNGSAGQQWLQPFSAGPSFGARVNKKLVISIDNNGSGNLTGGHANNFLRVFTYYELESSIG